LAGAPFNHVANQALTGFASLAIVIVRRLQLNVREMIVGVESL